MRFEIRAVGDDGFEEVYPLLTLFHCPRMSKQDWRRMLFEYAWPGAGPVRGYALYADGEPVGFYGTIFSSRPFQGRTERFCNPACWVVRKEFRSTGRFGGSRPSLLLLEPVLALRDCTVVHLTPSPVTYDAFARHGARPLESEVLFLPPLPGPAEAVRSLRGDFTSSPEELGRALSGDELSYFRDLAGAPVATHLLLQVGSRRCYVIATPTRRKGVRIAAIRYAGDLDFFWEHRILVQVALARTMGTLIVEMDGRFARGRKVPLALRHPTRRSYSPAQPDIAPELVDGLYSEWMSLRE